MIMTMNQYLTNPAGKGSSIIPNSDEIKAKYKSELESVKDRVQMKWYRQMDLLICHIQIPSSKNSSVIYDVVFEFPTSKSTDGTILNSEVRMFSNCPSFLFTYAYAIYQHGMGISWLKDKIGSQYLKTPANQKNAYNIVSYEKSIYMGFLYIKNFSTHIEKILATSFPFKSYAFKRDIKSSSEIMLLYKQHKESLNETKSIDKIEPKVERKEPTKPKSNKSGSSGITGKVKTTRNVRKTAASKKTKKI